MGLIEDPGGNNKQDQQSRNRSQEITSAVARLLILIVFQSVNLTVQTVTSSLVRIFNQEQSSFTTVSKEDTRCGAVSVGC